MTELSLRRLWVIYRKTAIAQGTGAGKRDLALSQVAFYSGARGVLKLPDHLLAKGEDEAVRQTASGDRLERSKAGILAGGANDRLERARHPGRFRGE